MRSKSATRNPDEPAETGVRSENEDRQRFLMEAGRLLASTLDYQKTLQTVADLAVPFLGDLCVFDVVGEDGTVQRVAWTHANRRKRKMLNEVFRYAPSRTFPDHPVIQVILTGQPNYVPQIADEWIRGAATSAEHAVFLRALGLGSLITVPLLVRERVLGAMTFCFAESGRRHTAADLDTATKLASQAALAVENAGLYHQAQREIAERRQVEEALRRQANENALLYEAGRLLGRTLDRAVIYDTMQEIISRAMDCDSLIVSLYTREDNLIRCSYAWIEGRRTDPAQFPALPLAPEGKGLQSRVIRTGEPLLIQDAQAQMHKTVYYANADGTVDTSPSTETRPTRSLLTVPIKLEGRVLGAAQVQSHRQNAYTPEHLRILEALMIQVAAASRNAFLYQQAQEEISERRRVEEENSRLLREVQEAALQQRTFLRDALASVTEGKLRLCHDAVELPPALPPAGAPMTLTGSGNLHELRRRAQEAAVALGFSEERWQNLVTAVSEAGMNAVVHAGEGVARVHADPGGTVQVWVEDNGAGIRMENLPRATLERGYTTAGTLGQGLKMMIQTADRIWLLTRSTGTTVVIEQDRLEPDPAWL